MILLRQRQELDVVSVLGEAIAIEACPFLHVTSEAEAPKVGCLWPKSRSRLINEANLGKATPASGQRQIVVPGLMPRSGGAGYLS